MEDIAHIGQRQHRHQIPQDHGSVLCHHRQIRQATPMGDSLMMRSMIFMNTSLKLSTT